MFFNFHLLIEELKIKYLIIVTLLFTLGGCAAPKSGEISFVTAMKQLSDGLDELRLTEKNVKDKKVFGLVPSTVTLTFAVEANNDSILNLVPPALVPFGANLLQRSEEKRGNNITIKFRNILFLEKGKLFMIKTFLNLLKKCGVVFNYKLKIV